MLEEFEERFKNIMEADINMFQRDLRLTALMTDLEKAYKIPIINDAFFNKRNEEVMKLYRDVANHRVSVKNKNTS
ncbi:hypothetical protein [Virgibacillus alimentarius]|uniref:hypothetical protein n=1 Tax=Virgibacillus alimentarius TaxID=698769 RepID=UPI0004933F83|nr:MULTISPECIES: hypothetical protein [Virgibacillus]HLR68222.1 hypothetical protein [Virgibacillus sp.]